RGQLPRDGRHGEVGRGFRQAGGGRCARRRGRREFAGAGGGDARVNAGRGRRGEGSGGTARLTPRLNHNGGNMAITFKVNGQSKTVDVPAEMPLLWVLRDVLDYKGTKFGCGIGQCGACTVHVNGTAVRSCQRRAGTVNGAEITTIEGLSPDGSHPLQRAW